jgi:hypothetical protein
MNWRVALIKAKQMKKNIATGNSLIIDNKMIKIDSEKTAK